MSMCCVGVWKAPGGGRSDVRRERASILARLQFGVPQQRLQRYIDLVKIGRDDFARLALCHCPQCKCFYINTGIGATGTERSYAW